MSLIVITGRAGSGKTTIARHLIANHQYICIRFAGILKNMLRILGLSDEEIDGELKEEPCSLLLGRTPRHAMQTLGTEWGRNLIHPNLWTHAWKCEVERCITAGYKVVCDDCRYENEAATARTFYGAQIWKVVRKDLPEPMNHSSEQEIDLITAHTTFKNYGNIGELKTAVDKIISSYDPT